MANATVYVATTGSDSTGTGTSGNPYATPGKAGSVITGSGNTIYIKAGTYVYSSTSINVAGGRLDPPAGASAAPNQVIGYNSTVGDLDDVNDYSNFPVLQGAAAGPAICINAANGYTWVRNLILDGNSQATYGLLLSGNYGRAHNVKAMRLSSYGFNVSGSYARLSRCLADTCGYGYSLAGHSSSLTACVAHACTICGFAMDTYPVSLVRCLAYANTGTTTDGYRQTSSGGSLWLGCVAHGNGRDGIRLDAASCGDAAEIRNCVLYGNTGYGIDSAVTNYTDLAGMLDTNAYGSNTAGASHNVPTGAHDVTLTGNPFTNAASGDFSLNTTAGAGGACRAAGFPGTMPLGLTVGNLDIGAAQHADPAGGGGPAGSACIVGVPVGRSNFF